MTLIAAAVALALPATARAGALQDEMAARWRGAWVVTTAEMYSDCIGGYTDNRVNGLLVSSRGRIRFQAGELAKVDSVDLKRSRLDLRLSVAEPLLLTHQDGPFTLYDESRCQVEFQVEVPRAMVKNDDARGMDRLLKPVLESYATEDAARESATWNRREREDYPRDYEQTLARHAAWKAEQANAAVQARIDELIDETSRIPERISGEPDYMSGFVKGVEAGRASRPTQCPDLMRADAVASRPQGAASTNADAQGRYNRGYQDGLRLTVGLDAIRRLPGCFVPVPQAP